MPAPATTGELKTVIKDMSVGDFLLVNYSNGAFNILESPAGLTELPLTGISYKATNKSAYYFYLIKVAKGLLIADRVWQHTYSWDQLNSDKNTQGNPISLGGTPTIMRSLTGGVSYLDGNGNKTTVISQNGGWPINNEFDKYITRFPQELIREGKTIADIFNTTGMFTWCQDTPINGSKAAQGASGADNVNRTARSLPTNGPATYGFGLPPSSYTSTIHGFRPIFEYREV